MWKDGHAGRYQSSWKDENNASIFQGHELEHIMHERTIIELDQEIFTNIIEDFFLSLYDNSISPKSKVYKLTWWSKLHVAMFSLESHEETYSIECEVVV